MRYFSLIPLLLLALAPLASQAEEKSDKPTEESKKSNEDAMLRDIPPGETFHGLRIPHMSPEGKLLMLFDTKSARRIDDNHLEMEDLKIEVHNDDGTTFYVQMPHSIFDLDTRILSSDTPVVLRREDFVINGDGAEFHTKTRFGRVTGNVKMVIFNTDEIE